VAGSAQAFREVTHDLYTDERWAKNGVLDRIFEKLQMEQIIAS
jgi:hypothetical protein